MSHFSILIINHVFEMSDPEGDYKSIECATHAGLKTAMDILGDEILAGSSSAAVEVSILDEEGVTVARSAVCSSVAPLLPNRQASRPERGGTIVPISVRT